MSGLRTVVVATDFSDTAGTALNWAAAIAREHGARLVVAHASAPVAPPAPEFVVLPASYFDETRRAAQAQLDALVAALQTTGVPCSSELALAPAVTGVLEIAARHRADLLVAGTRGRTGWKRVLLGSTAARLVRDAPCPVLTVHPDDARHPDPLRSVLVPTDFSQEAWHAVESAQSLLLPATSARHVLLHAHRLPADAPYSASARDIEDAVRASIASAHGNLAALARRLTHPGLTVEVRVREGHPAEVIVEEAKGLGVDLIAMGTHGRSGVERLWIGSTAERVLPAAPCPVLTVRARG
ncbi:MAG: universal stress protein [Thermodesulfobacteriota bacterium]